MKQYQNGSVRIQFLTKDIVRIEIAKKGAFNDANTLFIPTKADFVLEDVEVSARQGFASVVCGDVTVSVPQDATSLKDVKLYSDGELRYSYKSLVNSGELPKPEKTPYVYAVIDSPRVTLPEGGYSYNPIKNNGYIIDERAQDLYLLVCRGDAKKLRQLYVELCGRAEMPRLSTLASWNSRYYKYTQQEAEQKILDYEARDIPLDNIVIDTDWRKASDRGIGYDIDTNLFPDMKGYFDFAHKHNVEVMFNDHPEPFDGAQSVISPEEVQYRETKLTELLDMGLDYWWYDRNWHTKLISPSKGITPETWGVYLFHDITKHAWQRKAKNNVIYRRPILMGNVDNIFNGEYQGISNTASHRYAVQWTGDIHVSMDSLRAEIDNMLNAGDNVVAYAHPDAGGHWGNPDKETFIRWMEFCTLGTVFRPHCTADEIRSREPWCYDDETVNIVREYVKLRYRLLPIIYKQAYEAYKLGLPVVRRLSWNYPSDKKAAASSAQYMIGNDILVAPICGTGFTPVPLNDYITPVSATYYNGTELQGEPLLETEYRELNLYLKDGESPANEVPSSFFSARYETKLLPKEDVDLFVQVDDGARIWVDGKLVYDKWSYDGIIKKKCCPLSKGVVHDVKVEYFQGDVNACIALYYRKPIDPNARNVYLPCGQWVNLFSGKVVNGGKTVKVKAELDKIPLFVRLGSVLPLVRSTQTTKTQTWDRLTLDIYPSKTDGDSDYLYEDDRTTTAYTQGQLRITPYSARFDAKENAVVVSIGKSQGEFGGKYACRERKLRFKYHLLGECANVTRVMVDGNEVKAMLRSRRKGEMPLSDGNYAPDSRVLTFEVPLGVDDECVVKFYLA